MRTRFGLHVTTDRPRVTVFRSNRHILVQAIDVQGRVLAAITDRVLLKGQKLTKTEKSTLVGKEIAAKLKTKNINKVVFDRGAYRYHGRVKAVAEAMRGEGIQV